MKEYVKPVIMLDDESYEGVYTASGDVAENHCDSVYMRGIYSSGDPHAATYQEKFGCKGCNAFTGNGCMAAKSKKNDLRPAWERNGHMPYDTVSNGSDS